MTRIDERTDATTGTTERRVWPTDGTPDGIDPDGLIDDWDGVLRPLDQQEKDDLVARAVSDDREADAVLLKDDFQPSKDKRDAAKQSAAEMDWESTPPDPLPVDYVAPLNKWRPLDETPFDNALNNGQRISNLEAEVEDLRKLVNNLRKDQKKQHRDHRFNFAVWVRKFKKDQDDINS